MTPRPRPYASWRGAKRIPEWGLYHNSAAPPPKSPVCSDEPEDVVTLIPYGCTNLRVAEIPEVR